MKLPKVTKEYRVIYIDGEEAVMDASDAEKYIDDPKNDDISKILTRRILVLGEWEEL